MSLKSSAFRANKLADTRIEELLCVRTRLNHLWVWCDCDGNASVYKYC
jgi:hypothetical protein